MKLFKSKSLIGEDSIGIRKTKPTLPTSKHTHDYIEIVYVRNGTATEYVDGTSYCVKRGDVIFMTPNSIHAFEPSESFEHVEIFFSPHLVGEKVITPGHTLAILALTAFDNFRSDKSYGMVRFERDEILEVEAILAMMQKESENKSDGYEPFMCSCLNMLLIKMVRASSSTSAPSDVWQAIDEYIDKNSDKKITLASLASKCFYNPSYFSRIFKQRYGKTLTEHLRAKRIKRAKELLSDTDMTVEQIIQKIGFSDRSAFYSAFYANTGSTPSEYRLKLQK